MTASSKSTKNEPTPARRDALATTTSYRRVAAWSQHAQTVTLCGLDFKRLNVRVGLAVHIDGIPQIHCLCMLSHRFGPFPKKLPGHGHIDSDGTLPQHDLTDGFSRDSERLCQLKLSQSRGRHYILTQQLARMCWAAHPAIQNLCYFLLIHRLQPFDFNLCDNPP